MQKLISKYALAAHLAILAVAPQFFSLGTVLCLSALAFCWLIFEPSRLGEESLYAARKRVASAIVSDPVFWLTVSIFLFRAISYFNTGVAMTYDAESGNWSLSQPPFPYLPASASNCATAELSASAALIVVLQGCRNAMGRMARSVFLILFSAFSGVGALVYCVLCSSSSQEALALAARSFSNPQFLGVYHAMGLFSAIAAFSSVLRYKWYSSVVFIILGLSCNAAALFVFAPESVILVFASASFALILYTIIWHYIKEDPAQGLMAFIGTIFFLSLAVVLVVIALPESVISAKLSPILAGARLLPENFHALYAQLSDASLAIWKKCPWLGSGLGTFPDAMKFVASHEFWEVVPANQVSPTSLYWKVLAERGAIGAFLIVSLLSLILFTFLKRWIGAIKIFPQPSAMAGLFLLVAAAVDSMYGVSMLSAGTTVAFLSILAISASSFSKVKNNV